MSMPRKISISCPDCGASFEATIFDSINTDFAPDVPESIISGDRFTVKCPKCGFVSHLEYDLLYNDLRHNTMVWLIHRENDDFNKKVAEARAAFAMPGIATRMVHTAKALREKAACLEMGRDDRVIELCKAMVVTQLLTQYPDFALAESYYIAEKASERIYCFDQEGKQLCCDLDADLYHKVEKLFVEAGEQKENDLFPLIDLTWAFDFLSRHSREKKKPVFREKNIGLKCPSCGNRLPGDSVYCQYCGVKLEEF